MTLNRQLARLMAAVIVMIAAYVMPSTAQAHEGHAHGAVVTVAYAQASPVAVAPDTAKPAPARIVNARISGSTVIVASAGPRASMPAERPCDGLCCSMGMSCCAPGVLPDAETVHSPTIGSVRLIAPETPVFASVTLEALPKPPRSFA